MLHGYIWRLTCDQVSAVGTVQARKFLARFLARGEIALTKDSYFGAKLPGRFCPNFAYHFRVANNWPTSPDPLEDLANPYTVSLRAQEYDPVVIDLHIDQHPEISLSTRDQLSTERHKQNTPRFSSVPRQASALAHAPPAAGGPFPPLGAPYNAPVVDLTQTAPQASNLFDYSGFGSLQPQRPPHLPTPAALYSPPALPLYSQPPELHPPPARSLFPAFGAATQPPVVPPVAVARQSDPTQATILTAKGRNEASA